MAETVATQSAAPSAHLASSAGLVAETCVHLSAALDAHPGVEDAERRFLRRRELNAIAMEESRQLEKQRASRRQVLQQRMLRNEQGYFDKLVSEHRRRKRQAVEQTRSSPFLGHHTRTDFDRGERQCCTFASDFDAQTIGELRFRRSVMGAFNTSAKRGDPLARLHAERREHLEMQRREKSEIQAQVTEMKMQMASIRRPDYSQDVRSRREKLEEISIKKQEFMRHLSGWDGRKPTSRTVSIKSLWDGELKAMTLKAASPTPQVDAAVGAEDVWERALGSIATPDKSEPTQ